MFTENFKHMHKRWNSIMNSASDPVMVAVNCPQEHVDHVHLGDKTNPGCCHSALLPRVQQLDSAVTSLHWRLTVLAGVGRAGASAGDGISHTALLWLYQGRAGCP